MFSSNQFIKNGLYVKHILNMKCLVSRTRHKSNIRRNKGTDSGCCTYCFASNTGYAALLSISNRIYSTSYSIYNPEGEGCDGGRNVELCQMLLCPAILPTSDITVKLVSMFSQTHAWSHEHYYLHSTRIIIAKSFDQVVMG